MTDNESPGSVWQNCTLTASLPITGGGAEGLIIVTLNNTCITLLICYRWEGRLMCILSCGGGGGRGRGGRGGGGHLRHSELVYGEDLKYSAWRLFIEEALLGFKWIFLSVFTLWRFKDFSCIRFNEHLPSFASIHFIGDTYLRHMHLRGPFWLNLPFRHNNGRAHSVRWLFSPLHSEMSHQEELQWFLSMADVVLSEKSHRLLDWLSWCFALLSARALLVRRRNNLVRLFISSQPQINLLNASALTASTPTC